MYDLCFAIPGLGYNGGTKTLIEWANRSARTGMNTAVVSHADGPARLWVQPEVDVLVPGTAAEFASKALRLVARRLNRPDLDFAVAKKVVLGLLPRARKYVNGWASWGSLGCADESVYMQHYEPLMLQGRRWYERSAEIIGSLDVHIANSSWLLSQLEGRPQLVFPGVDLGTFKPGAGKISDRTLRVAALGRSEPWKGLADLVNALSRVDFAVELRTFGDDSSGALYERHIRLGRLSPPELAALYDSVDVVITPSWYESFPLPPLEAMACGAAVVTTRDGTEDYAKDGENCLVVSPRDVAGMAEALTCMRDPSLRRLLGEQAAQDARRFTWEAGYGMFRHALDLD